MSKVYKFVSYLHPRLKNLKIIRILKLVKMQRILNGYYERRNFLDYSAKVFQNKIFMERYRNEYQIMLK